MEGFLLKQSDHLKVWRERYFRMEDNCLLFYNERPADLSVRPRAIIRLDVCSISPKLQHVGDRYVFVINTPNGARSYTLAATDREMASRWLAALILATVDTKLSIACLFQFNSS
jgi:hypothetical protein